MIARELDLPSKLNPCGYKLDVTLLDGTKQSLDVEAAERLLDAQRSPKIEKPTVDMKDFPEALVGFSPSRGCTVTPISDPLSNFAHLTAPSTARRRVGD
jgi:hypothetical protein